MKTFINVLITIVAVFAALMSWCAAIGSCAIYKANGGNAKVFVETFLDGESTEKEEVKKPRAKKSYGFNW